MNGIQEAIDAMTAEDLGQLLAQAVPIIIAVWGMFAVWRQAKRLLNMLDDPNAEAGEGEAAFTEHPADFIDADGQVWEDGAPTGEYLYDAHVDDYDGQLWDGAESDFDTPEEEEAAHYAAYHQLLDESDDPDAAKNYAEEHGLDVDWERMNMELIQSVIDRGDFALADEMCNESGIDKLQLNWH